MVVATAPNGEPIYECFKCGKRGTGDNNKRVQIQDRQELHTVRLCECCRDYLKQHDFPMQEITSISGTY